MPQFIFLFFKRIWAFQVECTQSGTRTQIHPISCEQMANEMNAIKRADSANDAIYETKQQRIKIRKDEEQGKWKNKRRKKTITNAEI